MLFDPKWKQQTKADPLSLTGLIAWLEKQPADGLYCYIDGGACLIARYLIAHGHTGVSVGALGQWKSREGSGTWTEGCQISVRRPWTFGAALARARKLQAEQS